MRIRKPKKESKYDRHVREFLAELPPPASRETRKTMIAQARRGGITLVVGAGLSISRGIPNWENLARSMWTAAFPHEDAPWGKGREAAQALPQFLPFIFELAFLRLGKRHFFEALKQNLYANLKVPHQDGSFAKSNESLAVIARLLLQEYKRKEGRRIDAVISLNADDLLERAVSAIDFDNRIGVRPVARSTDLASGLRTKRAIPIYHLHGFLPSRPGVEMTWDYMLVFTDSQYWSTSASAQSFANRVMGWALNEGRCIFIGLSMTDINLLRWLALRTLERDRDVIEGVQEEVADRYLTTIRQYFNKHFWIRPSQDDPTGFLSRILRLRGIESVPITSWKWGSFETLMRKCFPSTELVPTKGSTLRNSTKAKPGVRQ